MADSITGLPATATALVWMGGHDFERRELPLPVPGAGEMLVAVELATVCGSDGHTVNGRRPSPAPSILGHEAVGRVVAVGPDPDDAVRENEVAVGDRVVWGVTVSCGSCDRCRAGMSAKCRTVHKIGHEPLDGPWPLSGAYATHLVLPQGATVVRVPDGVDDRAAAVAACAVATVVACFEAAGPISGRRVTVSGAGMLGLVACALSSRRGAACVVARDPDPVRRRLTEQFGATRSEAPDGALDSGGSSDVVFELSGAPAAVRSAMAAVAVGGSLVLAGSVAPAGPVDLDPEHVVRNLMTIRGVHNYEPRHLREAVDLLVGPLGELVAGVVAPPVGLDDLAAVLTATSDPWLRRSVDPRP